MQYICQGPVAGTYTEDEAKAAGRPEMAGHNKRGVKSGNGLIVPCNTDITGLIEAVPVDGADHEVKCPRCGNVSSVRRLPADDDGTPVEPAEAEE